MRIVHAVLGTWHRLVSLLRRHRIADEVDDEVRFHMEMQREQLERGGMSPTKAARAARRQFGNVTRLREETRAVWTFPSAESVVQDLTFALRTLRRAPGFSVVAVLVLAIAIGANAAIFSLVDAVLVRGVPYPESERLVLLIGTVERTAIERRGNSYPDFLDWRTQATSFDDMAAFTGRAVTIFGGETPERVQIEGVSASYFDVLRMAPALGRVFSHAEDEVGDLVAVLGNGLWQRRFGGDPAIVGRSIRVDAATYDVIGVMPAGFAGLSDQAELWVPIATTMRQAVRESRGVRGFFAVARLAEGTELEQAQAELEAISIQLEEGYPDTNEGRAVEVSPLAVEAFGDVRPAVLALMGAVGLVLLLACANVATLLVGRSESRQREIAVRTALGAGWSRLLRQLVTESLVLTGVGAIAGLGVAWVSVRLLIAFSPLPLPSFVEPELGAPVLVFVVGVALVCAVLLGIAPALHARVGRLTDALRESARGSSSTSFHVRHVLVVSEVFLAVILLVGAGLMIRTVQNVNAIDPGFEMESVLSMTLSVPRDSGEVMEPAGTPTAFVPWRLIIERLAAVPGVASASLASDSPLAGDSSAIFYSAEGDSMSSAQAMPRAYVHRATPGFFDTLGIPLVAGRTFDDAEVSGDRGVVIVSQNVVERFWPGEDPIGKRIKPGRFDSDSTWWTIVGVVPELNYRALPENPTADPNLYLPYVDREVHAMMLRTEVEPDSIVSSVRRAVAGLAAGTVAYNISSVSGRAQGMMASSQFTTWLMGLFAFAALVLAVVEIYGVMSYLVTQRTREFGIRLALGADAHEIFGMVLRRGAPLISVGLVLGVMAALAMSRLIESMLFGVSTLDSSSAVAVTLLAVVAGVACLVPALRATQVDPIVALRVD